MHGEPMRVESNEGCGKLGRHNANGNPGQWEGGHSKKANLPKVALVVNPDDSLVSPPLRQLCELLLCLFALPDALAYVSHPLVPLNHIRGPEIVRAWPHDTAVGRVVVRVHLRIALYALAHAVLVGRREAGGRLDDEVADLLGIVRPVRRRNNLCDQLQGDEVAVLPRGHLHRVSNPLLPQGRPPRQVFVIWVPTPLPQEPLSDRDEVIIRRRRLGFWDLHALPCDPHSRQPETPPRSPSGSRSSPSFLPVRH